MLYYKIWIVIFITILIDIISFSTILPVFPSILDFYKEQNLKKKTWAYIYTIEAIKKLCLLLGINEYENYINVLLGGLLGSLFSFMQFLTSPLFGALSDVYGRKPILLLSMFGISASYLLWTKAYTITLFLMSRIIGGFSKANISVLIAIATDITEHNERSTIMALIGSAFSLGFMIGPFLSGIWSSSYKDSPHSMYQCFRSLAQLSLSLSIANILFVWLFLPETHINISEGGKFATKNYQKLYNEDKKNHMSRLLATSDYLNPISIFSFKPFLCSLRDKYKLRILGMTYFSYLFLFSGLEFTLSFFTHTRFHFNSMDQGKMFCFIGIIMIAVQGGFVRRLSPNKEKDIALGALLLLIPSNILIAFSYNKVQFYFGLFLHSISTSMAVPCLSALVSQFDTSNQRGVLMGIHRSLGSLARALGPLCASFIFWCFGPTFCYTLGALLHVIPPLILYVLFY